MPIKNAAQLRKIIRARGAPVIYTDRPSQVFDYVLAHKIQNNGNSPTLREICAAIGINSTSNVSDYLDTLEAQGLIKRGFDKARSIEIPGWSYREDDIPESISERLTKKQSPLTLEISLADGTTITRTALGLSIVKSDEVLVIRNDKETDEEIDINRVEFLSVVAGEVEP